MHAPESPLPGMDPYLEYPSLWTDVHHRIINAIAEQLQTYLVPQYIARIAPYTVLEQVTISHQRRAIVPDVGMYEPERALVQQTSIALIDAAPLIGVIPLEIPTRYASIEIRAIADDTLVTAIELLSPANKRTGTEGATAYAKKRRELFNSDVHLLEIDLLQAGTRPELAQPAPLPDAPYFVFLSRANRRPEVEIWPCALHAPLPTVPIPLHYPDPDVPLNLAAVLQHVYRNARYDVQIDYTAAPPPPDLSPSDAAWLDAHLRERGLRP